MTSPCFLYLQTLSAWAVSFWFGYSPPGWMNFSVLKHFLFHIAWTMTDRGWQALITREEEANWQKPNFLERWVLILKLHGRGRGGRRCPTSFLPKKPPFNKPVLSSCGALQIPWWRQEEVRFSSPTPLQHSCPWWEDPRVTTEMKLSSQTNPHCKSQLHHFLTNHVAVKKPNQFILWAAVSKTLSQKPLWNYRHQSSRSHRGKLT